MNNTNGHIIFCDDVRQEITGKQTLVGVYTGDMMVPTFPIDIGIAAWARVYGLKKGERKFTARISHGEFDNKVDGISMLENEDRPLVMAFQGIPLSIISEGTIRFEISFDGSDVSVVGELPVVKSTDF